MNAQQFAFVTTMILCGLPVPPAGHAEDKSKEERAEEISAEGVRLYKNGFYVQAIKHFKKANDLVFNPANLYNIARCYDNLGEFRQAAIHYQWYLKKGGPNEIKAKNYLESIKLMPCTLVVESEPPGAKVFIDGNNIAAGTTPMEVDLEPGKHEVLVTMEGYAEQRQEEVVGFAEERKFQFTLWKTSAVEAGGGAELDVGYEALVPTSTQATAQTAVAPEVETGPGEEEPVVQGPPAKLVNLVATAGGVSIPVKFEQVRSFVGWSMLWQITRGVAGGGLGMDLQFGGTAQIYGFYAHGALNWEHDSGFTIFGRLGFGVGLLRCHENWVDLCNETRTSFMGRVSGGLGWAVKWFDIRVEPVNFLFYVWGSPIEDATAQWLPMLWVGYRF